MGMILSEPAIVPDVFASGLADAEDLGDGNMRFTFFARQKSMQDYAGAWELVIVARLVMPIGAVHAGMKATMQELGVSCCGAEQLRIAN